MSLRSSRSLSINLGTDKRKFEDLTDNDDDGQCIKRKKLCENEINDSSHSTSSSGSRSRPSSFARMYSSPTDTVGFPPDERLNRFLVFSLDKLQIPICHPNVARYMERL
ncbi:unnamed protein product [Rhizophagus irregularis]|nr:unnamed protein product [Rhizophagus irregularis]